MGILIANGLGWLELFLDNPVKVLVRVAIFEVIMIKTAENIAAKRERHMRGDGAALLG